MDLALFLMLSSLMQMQTSFESLSSSSSSINDNGAPLLFFMLAAVLSHAAAIYSHNNGHRNSNNNNNNDDDDDDDQHYFNSNNNPLFRNLPSDQIWALDPQVRDIQWRSTYGLSYPLFADLVEQLRVHVPANTLSMPIHSALAMVLFRLCQGYDTKTLASRYKVDPWIIARITNMVTRVLSTKLYSNYIRIPSGQRLLQIIQGFRELTGLPNLCGAIDGSHIKIHKRPSNQFIYNCRYNFFAILLQAVADHRSVFWDICVKAPGTTDDATHFRESSLFNKLIMGQALTGPVVTVRGNQIRPYLVGDWCYPLLSFLLTPFSSTGSGTPAQNLFDASLMRGRSSVEQAIGLLKGRWRILQDLNVGLNHAPQTIVACCVLHNICQLAGEPEPPMWKDPMENGSVARSLDSEKSFHYFGESSRQVLMEDLQERHQRLSSR